MTKQLTGCLLIGLLIFASGCAMCASPFDYQYAAYGGAVERVDPSHGRVGSAFQPAGVTVSTMGVSEAEEWFPADSGAEGEDDEQSVLTPSQTAPDAPREDAPPSLDSLLDE